MSSFNNFSSSNRNEDDTSDTTNPLYQLLEKQAGELETFARRMKTEIRSSHREYMKFQQQQQRIQQNTIRTKLDSIESGLVESLKARIREIETESTTREKKQKLEIQQLKRELNEFKNKFTLLFHSFEQTRSEMLSRNEMTGTRGNRDSAETTDKRSRLIEELRVLSNNTENDDVDVEPIRDNEGIITIGLNIPQQSRGAIIGKNGSTVNYIENETKTKINMRPNGSTISGTREGIEMARRIIENILESKSHNQHNDSDAGNTKARSGGSGDKKHQKRVKYTTLRFNISPQRCGVVIGKGGKTLNQIRNETKTKISISANGDTTIIGTKDRAEMAKRRIEGIIGSVIDKSNNYLESDVESFLDGDSILDDESVLDVESVLGDESDESVLGDEEPGETIIIKFNVPKHLHGTIIGKGGCYIKQLKQETRTHITIRPNGETTISGKKEGVEKARKRIEDKIESVNRPRDKNKRSATNANSTKFEDEIEDDVESTRSTIDDDEGFEANVTNSTSKLSMVPTIITHIPQYELNDDDSS